MENENYVLCMQYLTKLFKDIDISKNELKDYLERIREEVDIYLSAVEEDINLENG